MNGFILTIFLIATLLVARCWPSRTEKLRSKSPLDVDDGIPFPEAGQASSVFSLTALFGPYLVMALLLGIASLLGLAVGSVVGLIFVYKTIKNSKTTSFEDFLSRRLEAATSSGRFILILVSITHLGFALSELLILKYISMVWLHMTPDSASFFAVSMSLIAYLYCLDGGYLAVYRTDVLQFVFVGIFCLIICFFSISSNETKLENLNLFGRHPTLWLLDDAPFYATHLFNFIISAIMGLSFILATPDTWKRIYITTNRPKHNSIVGLVLAGNLPFLLILPLTLFGKNIADKDFLQFKFLFAQIDAQSAIVRMFVLLGFVASFLSSFDSSLMNSAHTLSLARIFSRKGVMTRSGLQDYQRNMGAIFLLLNVCFIAYPALGISNPYLFANVLLGNFAIIAGMLTASNFFALKIPLTDLITVVFFGISLWVVYIVSQPGILQAPSRIQIQTIPWGVFLFLSVYLFIAFRSKHKL